MVIWTSEDTSTKEAFMTTHEHISIPHSGNIHRLSGKTSTFSILTDLFIHSQSARAFERYKQIQIT